MTPEEQLRGTQIALQIAQNMLAQRDGQIIDLAAKLNMAEAENATLKAGVRHELRAPFEQDNE